MSLFDQVLARVERPRKDGDWYAAFCPVHETEPNGHHPSLRFTRATQVDDGAIVTCMAGCGLPEIAAALGLTDVRSKASENDPNSFLFWLPSDQHTASRIVAAYDYFVDDELVWQHVRLEPKSFLYRRPYEGHWAWGLSAGEYAQSADGDWRKVRDNTPPNAPRVQLPDCKARPLYHEREVRATAADGGLVLVTEGEKGCDAVRSLGYVATTAGLGATKWRASHTAALKGARVVILPDADEEGIKHAEIVTAALRTAGVECVTVRLPGLTGKQDPYDAVQAGLSADQLSDLIDLAGERREAAKTTEALKQYAGEFRLTEGGNAERFAAQHKERVAYVPEIGGLMAYRDGIYHKDDTALMRYAKQTVMAMYEQAAAAGDEAKRRALAEHARRSDTNRARTAMLSLAQAEECLEVPLQDFDSDPQMFCARNGVVDLRTGDLKPHSPQTRMTKMGGAAYSGRADCPLWLAHLDRIFAGDAETIGLLQRLLGYAMTGLQIEQLFAVFYGSGSNGKSLTLHIMERVLGDYAVVASSTTFSRQRTDAIRNDLARLAGARLVTTFERKAQQTLDEELIKQLTGGDKITARFLHQEAFEYKPQFLIVMSTNHKPRVETADYAIKRRVLLVPFEVTIPDEQQDKFLEEKLLGEIDGILSWGVVGAMDYLAGGLRVPEHVRAATDAYREEMDPLSGFREFITLEPAAWTSTLDIRQALEKWGREEGLKQLPNHKELAAWLESLGANPVRNRSGRGWRGVMVEGCHAEMSFSEPDRCDG